MYRDRDNTMNTLSKLSRVLTTPNKGGTRTSGRRVRRRIATRPTRSRRTYRNVFRRRRPARPRFLASPNWGRALPAAYANHVRARFNVTARSATSARVSGCDLVYPIPNTVQSDGSMIFACITSNPAYWIGTRIAQFAPAYMNFRPISMTFSYIPQVSVTQEGTVFMGTVWNGSAPASNIQQTLVTSNGGCLTQCYIPCDTTISLGSNLQQNLFTLNGPMSPDSSPFIFLAGVRGASKVPGYFYVTYTYEFKNPIGQAWVYGRREATGALDHSSHPNSSLVLLSQSGSYGPGTVIDLESDGAYYHGSPIYLDPTVPVFEFYNQQQTATANMPQNQANYISIGGEGVYSLADFKPLTSTIAVTGVVIRISGSMMAFHFVEGTADADTYQYYLETPLPEATTMFLRDQDQNTLFGGLAPISVNLELVNEFLLPYASAGVRSKTVTDPPKVLESGVGSSSSSVTEILDEEA